MLDFRVLRKLGKFAGDDTLMKRAISTGRNGLPLANINFFEP